MSRSPIDEDVVDVEKMKENNPNVDFDKVREARELLRALRKQGLSPRGYSLAPPYRRQMHVTSKHRNEDSDENSEPARAGRSSPQRPRLRTERHAS